MKATTSEKWISQTEISREEFGNDRQIYDHSTASGEIQIHSSHLPRRPRVSYTFRESFRTQGVVRKTDIFVVFLLAPDADFLDL